MCNIYPYKFAIFVLTSVTFVPVGQPLMFHTCNICCARLPLYVHLSITCVAVRFHFVFTRQCVTFVCSVRSPLGVRTCATFVRVALPLGALTNVTFVRVALPLGALTNVTFVRVHFPFVFHTCIRVRLPFCVDTRVTFIPVCLPLCAHTVVSYVR